MKTCEHCKILFPTHGANKNKRFCGRRCRFSAYRKNRITCEKSTLSSGAIGTISELIVCSDLLQMGFYVFRSVTPNSPCDLIALIGGNAIQIEVKTSVYNLKTKKFYYNSKSKNFKKYNHLASVNGKSVFYGPPLLPGSANP